MAAMQKLTPQKIRAFFILFLFIYALLGLSGYGADSDAYRMIRAGHNLILNGRYFPSRYPGYLFPEIVIGGSSLLGGFYLSNLISALLGTFTLVFFFRLLRTRFNDPDALLLTAAAGLNPFFVIAASSSMDYVYSLFFILAGITLMNAHKQLPAALLFALAVSSRPSNALIVAAVYLVFILAAYRAREGRLRPVILSALTGLGAAVLLFLPIYRAANNSFRFLAYSIGDWDLFGYLSRFVYKNVYVWGLLPFALVAITALYSLYKTRGTHLREPLAWAGLLILLLHELLFLKVPLAKFYLLPVLFIILPLWMQLVNSRKLAALLVLFTIAYNFINVDVLDIQYTESGNEAVGAQVGLYLTEGVLIEDIKQRRDAHAEYFQAFDLPVERETSQ